MDEQAAHTLARLDVRSDSLREKIANLSSEQRQMIAIARAILHDVAKTERRQTSPRLVR